ncbi:MAG: helix-turn-helix domain-containing protein [Candidatus Binatia bacterium]
MTTPEPFDPLLRFAEIERLVAKIYYRFSHLFLSRTELRDFWREMAREEEQHASMLAACQAMIADNVIEHTMILAEGERITLKDLPQSIVAGSRGNAAFTFNLRESLRQFEKQHILRALEQVGHDRKEAAKLLDISLSSLYRKIEELEIS